MGPAFGYSPDICFSENCNANTSKYTQFGTRDDDCTYTNDITAANFFTGSKKLAMDRECGEKTGLRLEDRRSLPGCAKVHCLEMSDSLRFSDISESMLANMNKSHMPFLGTF
jgi:hypothetical protein